MALAFISLLPKTCALPVFFTSRMHDMQGVAVCICMYMQHDIVYRIICVYPERSLQDVGCSVVSSCAHSCLELALPGLPKDVSPLAPRSCSREWCQNLSSSVAPIIFPFLLAAPLKIWYTKNLVFPKKGSLSFFSQGHRTTELLFTAWTHLTRHATGAF